MEPVAKTLELLFEQLGLPSDQAGMDAFIAEHYPLPDDVKLTEASFWTPAQVEMLRDALASDDAWEPVVDELNVLLHENRDRAGAPR